ncbi:MAG: hypothetical protein IPN76_22745 [Saprospiraceae bacterium]|nr:hypothetical protein [Saprospiraceae bacterium]
MNLFYQNIPRHPFVVKFPDTQTLIERLYLAAILDAYTRIRAISGIVGLMENKIRNEVVRDFKFNNPIIKEYFQSKTIYLASENQANTASLEQRTDLEIHSGHHQHNFVIECKNLTHAENRYVQGRIKNGEYRHDGLEKFVDLTYAETDDEGAMLSFIVNGTPTLIVSTLNQKVQAFKPSSDCANLSLQKCVEWDLSFQSSHICTNGKVFRLYHLFYDLT